MSITYPKLNVSKFKESELFILCSVIMCFVEKKKKQADCACTFLLRGKFILSSLYVCFLLI